MPAPQNYSVQMLSEMSDYNFGKSAPILVDQARINQFAECTGDHQWIHVDEARAARESPFGGTIAHGFLLLSLVGAAQRELGI